MNPYANLMASSLMKKFDAIDKQEVKTVVNEPAPQYMSAQEAFRELMCDGKLNGDSDFYNELVKEG